VVFVPRKKIFDRFQKKRKRSDSLKLTKNIIPQYTFDNVREVSKRTEVSRGHKLQNHARRTKKAPADTQLGA
jgi:hypothetical protein